MKTFWLVIFSVGYSFLTSGTVWNPDDELLDAVCQIESAGGRYLCGDDGFSLGHFQLQKGAWSDVSAWRKHQKLPIYNYHPNVLDPKINRLYAAGYLTIIHDQLKRKYRREPSPSEMYAAYNMGMSNFRKCNYDLSKVNKITVRKGRRIEALLNQSLAKAEDNS